MTKASSVFVVGQVSSAVVASSVSFVTIYTQARYGSHRLSTIFLFLFYFLERYVRPLRGLNIAKLLPCTWVLLECVLASAPFFTKSTLRERIMSIQQIAAFSAKAKADADLATKLKACEKLKEMFALAKEYGFELQEDALYPPNEPQFTEDQLSERLVKALLRA